MSEKRLVVCVNERLGMGKKSCAGSGSRELIVVLRQLMHSLSVEVRIIEQVCLGRCEEGIAMRIAPGGPFFTRVTERDLPDILRAVQEFDPPA